MTTQEIVDRLKSSSSFEDIKKMYISIGCTVNFTSYSNVSIDGNSLVFEVQLAWVESKSGLTGTDNASIILLVGQKTKSGYLSTKKLGLDIKNVESLSFEETVLAVSLQTDAINQKFDPFFSKNNRKRKNAAGWVSVASKLQDDCR